MNDEVPARNAIQMSRTVRQTWGGLAQHMHRSRIPDVDAWRSSALRELNLTSSIADASGRLRAEHTGIPIIILF